MLVRAPPEHEPPLPIHAEPVEDPARLRHALASWQDDLAQIVGEGLGCHDRGEDWYYGLGEARPQLICVTVRAEDGVRCGHGTSRCREFPILADPLQRDGRAVAMDAGARGRRRSRQTTCIREWLDRAAAPIEEGADVSIGTGAPFDFATLKDGDIGTLRQPFLGAL